MGDKPVWLMDVDGVLNAYRMRVPGAEMRSFKAGNGYLIMYNVDILKRIAAFHTDDRVEIRWLTTWEEQADEFLAEELGMPRGLAVQGQMPKSFGGKGITGWWKLDEAQLLVSEGHRVIWTDDEIEDWPKSADWVAEADPSKLLWYAPDDAVGITHEFLDRVEAWL